MTAPARWTWTDLRLVPAAAASWSTALVAPAVPRPALLVVAGGGLLASLPLMRARGTPAVWVALGVLAAVVLGAGTAAVRDLARDASPLRAAAERHGTLLVQLALDDLPRRTTGAGPPRVVAAATVSHVSSAGTSAQVDDAVLLFAPADGWADLTPGTPVRVRVTAAPPEDGGPVAVLSARGPPDVAGRPGRPQQVAQSLRNGLSEASARILGGRVGGLLPGLVVGDTSGLDPVLDEDFRRTGLAHLTAVSGANVAIVVAGVLWPLRRRAVDRRAQAGVAGLALAGFVVLAGPSASVLRAAAMGAVTLVALASGRERAAVPALCTAILVLLLLEPRLAADPGFALSVVATAAIVLLAPSWSRTLRGKGLPALVADAVAVSAAAGLATAPVSAGLSGQVSLVSLPANLLAAPVVAPATVLGLLAALLLPLGPVPGDALVWLAGWPVRWLVLVAERGAEVPDAAAGWPVGVLPAIGLTLALLVAGTLLWRLPRLRPVALAVLLGVLVLGWPLRQAVRGWPPASTVVVACDVGQGDALVVPTGPGEAVLVDTGPDVGAVDRCLTRLGIQRLRLVLLSHLDADHAGGLAGALAGRDVDGVATGTLSPADDRGAAVDRLAAGAGARREVLVPGDHRRLGAAELEVLAPPPGTATAGAPANDLSVVARVTVHGVRVLFTGDLSAEAQARVLDRGVDLRADVLKVPHHGSADVDPGFLAATGARVALVSVGADNTYGHPTARALDLLDGDGMRIHRTDREGDLAVAGTAADWGVAVRGGGAVASAPPPLLASRCRTQPDPGSRRRLRRTAELRRRP